MLERIFAEAGEIKRCIVRELESMVLEIFSKVI